MQNRGLRAGLLVAFCALPGVLPARPASSRMGAGARVEMVAQQLAEATNLERVRNGLAPLKVNDRLSSAASWLARDMAQKGYFEHDSPGGHPFRERLEMFGYLDWRSVAENIAAGIHTPSGAVASWLNSADHRENLLNPNFTEIGVGYYQSPGSEWKRYWVQDFGMRLGYYPVIINNEAPQTTGCEVTLYVHGEGWARRMRFSNDRAAWSRWEPFRSTRMWQLAPGAGRRTVYAQISGDSGTFSSQDSIELVQASARKP